MSQLLETFEELARFRQGMYRIYSAAFLPPEPERFVDLIGGAEVLETMGLPYLAFYREWVPWREALFDVDDVIVIDIEYTRMFATGVAGAVSPPTESFYIADPIRGEVGEVLADLQGAYNRYRLEPTSTVADTLDHVSIELEIMSALCEREAEARADENERRLELTLENQVEFLGTHLGAWLPRFVQRIASVETAQFYATLGPAVASFVHHDAGVARFLSQSAAQPEPAQ
ncbi:MAG: molecular chaperone [Acidimicrobiia bacterium]